MEKRMSLNRCLLVSFFLLGIHSAALADTIYVKVGGTGDGSSWANAYGDLQLAIDDALDGDQIWVAKGTYKPTTFDRDESFHMKSGVEIYGGFPDTGNPGWGERNYQTNATFLSGDVGFENYHDDNSYQVIYNSGVDSNAVLDGFTIEQGEAYDEFHSGHPTRGAGMFNTASSPVVRNCTFFSNRAEEQGGGMWNSSGSSPSIINCTFSNNIVTREYTSNYDVHGGAIFNDKSNVNITDCVFDDNDAKEGGGAICNNGGILVLSGCNFIDNRANLGGAIFNKEAPYHSFSTTVDNCIFNNNIADQYWVGSYLYDGYGGAINCSGGHNCVLTNCTFTDNWAMGGNGGAVKISGLMQTITITITNCAFNNNTGDKGGGIFHDDDGSPTITDCAFSGNSANDGGGMYNNDSSATLTNCTFTGNSAGDDGGGMYSYSDSSPTLTNCTFTGNSADIYGGGMCNIGNDLTLTNCILWGNAATNGNEIYNGSSTPVISYCDIQSSGGSGAGWDDDLGDDYGGNIDADPCFVDADGADDTYGSVDDNLRLSPISPCIDAGDSDALPIHVTTDLDGGSRFIDDVHTVDTGTSSHGTIPVVDMGAYEHKVIHVHSTASGVNDGSSWDDAFTLLQDALDEAVKGDYIWVAAKEPYNPTYDYGLGIGDRGKHFRLINDVGIYGGFPSRHDPDWNDRDPESYESILSGDIGTVDDPCDNCYHVFYHPDGTGLDATAILDGVTISRGNANDVGDHANGGGMYSYDNSPTLTNCTFIDNSAILDGGGLCNAHHSSPAVSHCTFISNIANDDGGGMYNWRGSEPSVSDCVFNNNTVGNYGGGMCNCYYNNPSVTECIFLGNVAAICGGGMKNHDNSSPTVTGCTFTSNLADIAGGGMDNQNNSDPTLTNCTFSRNSTYLYGGAMKNDSSSPTLTNCTFSGNFAGIVGGGMDNYNNSDPTLTNCILWGNTAPSGPQIYNDDASCTPIVTYTCVEGGYTGTGNISDDPLFVDAGNDDVHLMSYSPCIDAGDPSGDYSGQVDIDGESRVRYDNVDMGADEVYQIAGDLEPDEDVDVIDLAAFAEQWLSSPCSGPGWCDGADFNGSSEVNLEDFAIMSSHWLVGAP